MITSTFTVINKDEGILVYTNEMRLRMLNKKLKVDFLVAMKTNIEMRMNMVTTNMTYSTALVIYRIRSIRSFRIHLLIIE